MRAQSGEINLRNIFTLIRLLFIKCACGCGCRRGLSSLPLFFFSFKILDMPQYVLITTQIRLENGPTICGDELSDPVLMAKLEAQLVTDAGNPLYAN